MADIARELFEKDGHARSLGAELIATDSVVVQLTVEKRHLNFGDVCHGGVIFGLADIVMSLVSNGQGRVALAVDAHTAFTAGVHEADVLTATAETVHAGRTAGTYRVTVTRSDERVAAAFTGTVLFTGESW